MERLTYRGSEKMTEDGLTIPSYSDYPTRRIIERLAEYETLEEQGLLLRLPTEVYFIKNNNVCKGWIQEVVYSVCRKLLLDIRYHDNSLDSYKGYLGNDVFLTKEEAEQKLKEMEDK